jgi:hypothetical protein
MFGEKHVGSTFQEAMADPSYMNYVIMWMVPRTFEEKVFKRYINLELDKHKTGEPEAISWLNEAELLEVDEEPIQSVRRTFRKAEA